MDRARAKKPGIGIGALGVGGVGALLAVDVALGIAVRTRRVATPGSVLK
jgi:hypothetical protein